MRPTRDLMHRDGYLLLARDHVLNASEIAHLQRLEEADRQPLTLFVAQEK